MAWSGRSAGRSAGQRARGKGAVASTAPDQQPGSPCRGRPAGTRQGRRSRSWHPTPPSQRRRAGRASFRWRYIVASTFAWSSLADNSAMTSSSSSDSDLDSDSDSGSLTGSRVAVRYHHPLLQCSVQYLDPGGNLTTLTISFMTLRPDVGAAAPSPRGASAWTAPSPRGSVGAAAPSLRVGQASLPKVRRSVAKVGRETARLPKVRPKWAEERPDCAAKVVGKALKLERPDCPKRFRFEERPDWFATLVGMASLVCHFGENGHTAQRAPKVGRGTARLSRGRRNWAEERPDWLPLGGN